MNRRVATLRLTMAALAVTACAAYGALRPVAGQPLRVTGENVNFRAGPGGRYEVVCQGKPGQLVVSRGDTRDGYISIEPPSDSDLWIYADLVEDGVVIASKVRVRSGAGINYREVGRVDKQDLVTIRGRTGDWLKIAPPKGSTLWVSADYVEDASTPKPAAPKPTPVAEPKPAVAVVAPPSISKPRPKPAPIAITQTPRPAQNPATPKRPLVDVPVAAAAAVADQAKSGKALVEYIGTVRKAAFVWRRPSRYRLEHQDKIGRPVTVCYLLHADETVQSFLNQAVRVRGEEYWVQGVRHPVLVPREVYVRGTESVTGNFPPPEAQPESVQRVERTAESTRQPSPDERPRKTLGETFSWPWSR